jgi:hypothetical protein
MEFQGCPGSRMMKFENKDEKDLGQAVGKIQSQLRQWPIQMHLISPTEVYMEKIKAWIDDARINTLTVLIMQVPCCMGLLNLAQQAAQAAERKVPLKFVVVGVQGDILQEEWA